METEVEARARSKLISLAGAILTAAGALGDGRGESAYSILREVRDELDDLIAELAERLSSGADEGCAEVVVVSLSGFLEPGETIYQTLATPIGGGWS